MQDYIPFRVPKLGLSPLPGDALVLLEMKIFPQQKQIISKKSRGVSHREFEGCWERSRVNSGGDHENSSQRLRGSSQTNEASLAVIQVQL